MEVPYSVQYEEIVIEDGFFDGPAMNYFLSDTFDDKITLKTHIEETFISGLSRIGDIKKLLQENKLLKSVSLE